MPFGAPSRNTSFDPMKTIPSLSNGLPLAFDGLWSHRDAFGAVTLTDFTVTLGGMLTLDVRELAEISRPVYSETKAIALEVAREESESELREQQERKSWFASQ